MLDIYLTLNYTEFRKDEKMIEVLNKIGTNKEILGILHANGWVGNYSKFAMQKHRGRLTTDVTLILWDYCNKNGINVKPEDFKGE